MQNHCQRLGPALYQRGVDRHLFFAATRSARCGKPRTLGSMATSVRGLSIAVESEPAADDVRAIFDGLAHANIESTGDRNLERLCIVARGNGSDVVGGIYGEVYWGWLNILALWVA